MAELHVQPKKKTSILPWLLLALGLAALIWFLTRDKGDADTVAATTDTATTTNTTTSNTATATTGGAGWDGIDFNAPAVKYDEITNDDIEVRGNNDYSIYGMGENILFDEGKATLRADAEANLKQISGSIGQRYNGGEVRVFGFTDAQGTAGNNKELAQQRADAVKAWMQNNGITSDRISVHAIGEGQPVATNNTEAGRQQNRRVEIVARGAAGANGAQQ
jgi:outer membrane protein OmpA-like peptidoglycan-associated protein